MTEKTANPVLEILRRVQQDMSPTKEDMHLMRLEMTAMPHIPASLPTMQDVHGVEIGVMTARLDRIESRPDLTEQDAGHGS